MDCGVTKKLAQRGHLIHVRSLHPNSITKNRSCIILDGQMDVQTNCQISKKIEC